MRLGWCRDGHGMIGWPGKAQNVIPRLVPFADVNVQRSQTIPIPLEFQILYFI